MAKKNGKNPAPSNTTNTTPSTESIITTEPPPAETPEEAVIEPVTPIVEPVEEPIETPVVGGEENIINTSEISSIVLPERSNKPIEITQKKVEKALSDEDILNQAVPGSETEGGNFTALTGQRPNRDYVNELNQEEVIERVEPVEFIPADPDDETPEEPQNKEKEEEEDPGPLNPGMKDATSEEAQLGAEMLADMLLGLYRGLNDGAVWVLKVSPFKITMKTWDDKLPKDGKVPYGTNGEEVPIPKFWDEYNKAVEGTMEIPEDYFKDVRKSMIRLFKKKGLGISDEQNIVQFFGRDLLKRTTLFGSLLRQQMMNMKLLEKMYEDQKEILRITKEGQRQ